ncbi:hypothetical protein RCL1_002918 [Eukaryota sp. TZLM3-RCL]
MKDYHPNMVIEMDETLAPWAPEVDHTYAPVGTKCVAIDGNGDRCGCTVTLTVTKSGKLLPPQIIWSGLTTRSVPSIQWPEDFVNCFSGPSSKENKNGTKWQNRKTVSVYLLGVVQPYLQEQRSTVF